MLAKATIPESRRRQLLRIAGALMDAPSDTGVTHR